jgi:hypothetical protein
MSPHPLALPSFSANPWQMSFGERAVIEGVLAQCKPKLAIEIGTAEGGSLERVAAYSERVISFDLVEPQAAAKTLPNVELRTGDSHVLLAQELERLAAAGEMVDFVLIDGDHTAAGARSDMEDVLASDAVKTTFVLAHDSLNPEVRRGLDEVDYGAHEKVAWVEMDFVGGYVPDEPPLRGECWGGLGLVVVDATGEFGLAHAGRRSRMVPLPDLIWDAAAGIRGERATEHVSSTAEANGNGRAEQLVAEMQGSLSWRLTAPLRTVAAWSRRKRGERR